MRIITNADDFGQDDDTVAATIECFERGALTSATIMPRMPATQKAVDFARKHPEFSFGVHLTFVRENDGTPESPVSPAATVPSLVDADGRLLPSNKVRWQALFNRIPVEQIERETSAQIQFLLDQGVKISHVDSHGHLHKFAPLRAALKRVLPRFGINRVRGAQDIYLSRPLRSPTYWFGGRWRRKLRSLFRTPEHFFMPAAADAGWPQLLLPRVKGDTLEVGVHPGYSESWRDDERKNIQAFAPSLIAAGAHQLITWNEL
jgi:hypothetical protein